MPKKVSIIIRTKNEERWISSCLSAVFRQDYENFEVIIVDNKSTDKTIAKAKRFDIKLFSIENFLPGRAINEGIIHSDGEYICCLSGHCIPANNQWLTNLARNIEEPNVAGVYGRQLPLSYTSDLDKRDLLIAFGLDRKVQVKDPFFHNANSLIKREIWKHIPFDETATNIEDRIWAKEVLTQGYRIIYDPEACVYHHHGIHQSMDIGRCRQVVHILESLDSETLNKKIDIDKLNSACIIPVKGSVSYLFGKPLVEYTLQRAEEARYVKHVIITSDNPEYFEIAGRYSGVICIERPSELCKDYIEIEEVLKLTVDELENQNIISDIIVSLSVTYPFRQKNLMDDVIRFLVEKGYDSVIPTIKEYRSCWRIDHDILTRIDEGFVPSQYKNPLHIGLAGLITATHTEFIRQGQRVGPKVGLYEIDDVVSSLDVGKHHNLQLAEKIIEEWWKENDGE